MTHEVDPLTVLRPGYMVAVSSQKGSETSDINTSTKIGEVTSINMETRYVNVTNVNGVKGKRGRWSSDTVSPLP